MSRKRARTLVALVALVGFGLTPVVGGCSYECKMFAVIDVITISVGAEAARSPVTVCVDSRCFVEGTEVGQVHVAGGVVSVQVVDRLPAAVGELRFTSASVTAAISTPKVTKVYPQDKRCGYYREITLRYDQAARQLVPAGP